MSDGTEGLLPPGATYGSLVGTVSDAVLRQRVGRLWWAAFAVSSVLTLALLGSIIWLFVAGIGIWGVNSVIVWGFAIANYVWWIGIGNAGTLISAMLLLARQDWRASINRFAETMTLFAVSIAGLFPILHLGRFYRFYWLAPYPNTMGLWPQWRSALVWDFAAIISYLIFSIMFWYLGLIPDLATLRDRAQTRAGRMIYGALALGWRGSAKHWYRHDAVYYPMAAMAVPLVVSVHSVVGMDFAASLVPGWQETIYPPYFVVGALYSGFGMVVVLTALIRWGFGLQSVVRVAHFEAMGKVILISSLVMGTSYATEWFMAWYGGERAELSHLQHIFFGAYSPVYYTMLTCNVLIPQILWFPQMRRSIAAVVIVSVLLNIGMWLERILIIWNILSHGYLPSMWRLFYPTVWDWLLLAASFGFYAFMFLCIVRLVPFVAMHDLAKVLHRQERKA